jgi:hypothetical protein
MCKINTLFPILQNNSSGEFPGLARRQEVYGENIDAEGLESYQLIHIASFGLQRKILYRASHT